MLHQRDYSQIFSQDSKQYEDWRYYDFPNLLEVLNQFPSIKMSPSLLTTQLPMIQNRFYSISSSPMDAAGEIHATITIVNYRTRSRPRLFPTVELFIEFELFHKLVLQCLSIHHEEKYDNTFLYIKLHERYYLG